MEFIFTIHAELRINRRRISKEDVLSALKYPDKVLKKHGKYYAQKAIGRGSIEVVHEKTEKYIKIITVYWM